MGAPLRYLVDRTVQAHHDTTFPWGTFNVTGSMILGVLTGAALSGAAPRLVQDLLGIGLCGALTTYSYSTFSYETLALVEAGARLFAVANVVASVVAGLGAVFLGLTCARAAFA